MRQHALGYRVSGVLRRIRKFSGRSRREQMAEVAMHNARYRADLAHLARGPRLAPPVRREWEIIPFHTFAAVTPETSPHLVILPTRQIVREG